MKHSGIYYIQIGPWFYYGQSVDLKRRRREHLSALKADLHSNQILQSAYNKYQQFEFTVVGSVPVDELDGAEQFFIDCFWGEDYCANLAKDAASPGRGLKRSEETKEKISAAAKARPPMSEETRAKIGAASSNRSDETKVKMSKRMSGTGNPMYGIPGPGGLPSKSVEINGIVYASQREAARQLGVHRCTLRYWIDTGYCPIGEINAI